MEQSQQVSDNDVTQALTESGSLDISVSRIPVNENSKSLLEARAEPNNNICLLNNPYLLVKKDFTKMRR